MMQANCSGAWAADEGGDPGVKVAVLDTGVDPDHFDLLGRVDVDNSTTFISANDPFCLANGADDVASFLDYNFHGSFVSGIITSNGLGVAGVAPAARVVGVKVLNCLGSGSFADIIAGILYAASLDDVDVINMSLGAYFPKSAVGGGQLNAAMAKAINWANSHGVLVVSSAGNDGAGPGVGADLDHDGNFVHVPSQAGAGIGVWAGDIDGNVAGYSNFGLTGAWVGAGGGDFTPASSHIPLAGCVLAPDLLHGFITSVCSTHSIFFGCGPSSYLLGGSGTSFSAPLVSGVAALVDGKAGGSLNAGQIKTILKQTADDLGKAGADGVFSHGRVNAGNAVMH
jgi:subtilisin family serine protease